MDILLNHFESALKDYYYLMNHDYSHKATLKLVGDRYRLTGTQRSVLQRGVVAKETARKRLLKLKNSEYIQSACLLVDFYNVYITLVSYLSGKFVYISNDGFLRDTSESRGRINNSELGERAILLLLRYFENLCLPAIELFFDSPISNSKKLAYSIEEQCKALGIKGQIHVVKSADHEIIKNTAGIAASSDSVIIDNTEHSFDLAKMIINYHFDSHFFRISDYL